MKSLQNKHGNDDVAKEQEMKMRYILLIGSLLLSACNLAAPAATNTSVPVTQVMPSATPIPSSTLFRDDFDATLKEGWAWQNEDPASWSLSTRPGWIEINVQRGHIVASNYTNLMLRLAPAGDFQIETSLEFEPVANFQFAGLVVYQSDVDFLQAGRAYCDPSGTCVGSGLYFDNYSRLNVKGSNLAAPYEAGELVYLRLQRKGDTYIFFASPDAIHWIEMGQHQNELEPLLVGVVAGQNNDGAPISAYFGYFQISELTE
jgi:beta-xylosidase